ncbi:MAG: sensor histidine kinase [Microbacterium sp.]
MTQWAVPRWGVPVGESRSIPAGGWRSVGRPDVILAAALAVVLLPATLLALVQGTQPVAAPVLAVLAALFAVLHTLSFTAFRFPVASFAVASLIMLVLAVLPGSDGVPAALYPSSVAFLLCLAQVAIHCSRPFGLAALAVGVTGSALITLMSMRALELQTLWGLLVGLIALVSVAWAIGTLQQVRRQRADERERTRVEQAIAEERMRINRDLHDVVAHSMTVMIAQAEVARAYVRDDPDASTKAMSVVVDTGRDALRGMRRIVTAESDAPREPVPDIDTIAADAEGARSIETAVTFTEDGRRGLLDAPARIALRHAVREALTNAIRHTAAPRRIDVRMDWSAERVVTTITDDGGAGSEEAVTESPGSGIGLIGMAERIRSAGGATSAAAADPGWIVRVELPRTDTDAGTENAP